MQIEPLNLPSRLESRDRRQDGARIVADPTGGRWRVSEWDATGVPGCRGVTFLVFDAGRVVQRVWRYPANWRVLPDAELLAACAVHAPVEVQRSA